MLLAVESSHQALQLSLPRQFTASEPVNASARPQLPEDKDGGRFSSAANFHRRQKQENEHVVCRQIEREEATKYLKQQTQPLQDISIGSDNKLNEFHSQILSKNHTSGNTNNKPDILFARANGRLSSPGSDASLIMRAPVMYRPDASDAGATGPLMPLSQPACLQVGVAGPQPQRLALKLAPQQQQQQQQHLIRGQKVPLCQRTTWPPAQPDYANYNDEPVDGEQQSDECSCSSSIDCLSSSAASHLVPEAASVNPLHHHLHPQHQHPHPHPQHPQRRQHHLASDDDCAFMQQEHHHQQHHHHPTFHHHRPLVPHSSVPPYAGSAGPHAQPPPQQHPQQHPNPHLQPRPQAPQQQPAPLIRQTTYTATPDTITDSAPIPLTPPPPPVMGVTNNPELGAAYHTMSRLEQKQHGAAHYSKQRQTVSFRRSATADYAAEQKATGSQQQQAAVYTNNNTNAIANNTDDKSHKALVHRQRSPGIGLAASAPPGAGTGKQAAGDSVAKGNNQPAGQLRPANLHNTSSPLSIVTNNTANNNHFNAAASITPAGNNSAYPPNSPMPSQAAIRAGLLTPLSTTFDGVCSLPAIASHRTNSPWMRISSIILAPIGIVIILFIVVSPLLHYLM